MFTVIIKSCRYIDSLSFSLSELVSPMIDGMIRQVIVTGQKTAGQSESHVLLLCEEAGVSFVENVSTSWKSAAEKAVSPWLVLLEEGEFLDPSSWNIIKNNILKAEIEGMERAILKRSPFGFLHSFLSTKDARSGEIWKRSVLVNNKRARPFVIGAEVRRWKRDM